VKRHVVVVLAVTLVAASAHAGPTDEARKEAKALFDQGIKLAENGDSKGALASFRAAYAKAPTFRVLYNIGQLCWRIGDGACAVRAYKQYLDDGGPNVPAARRQAVEGEIRALSRTVGYIRVITSISDAEVTIDDQTVGRTPIATAWIANGGSHKAVLVKDDKRIERNVVVISGETATVVLDVGRDDNGSVAALPPAAPADEPKKPPPEDHSSDPPPEKHVPIVPWVVTGMFAAGTVVTGILAAGAYSSFKSTRDSYPVTRDDLDSAQGKARDLFIVTSVLGAATVISLGIAGYLTLSSSSSAKVGVAAGPTGIAIVGVTP
jgi:hypothetical protein